MYTRNLSRWHVDKLRTLLYYVYNLAIFKKLKTIETGTCVCYNVYNETYVPFATEFSIKGAWSGGYKLHRDIRRVSC